MQIIIKKPDDWHHHLRDGDMLKLTTAHAGQFGRVVAMPNLCDPVTTVAKALAYSERILAAMPNNSFMPLMTLYITDNLSANEIELAAKNPQIIACKLYPQNATTNSQHGINDLKALYPVFEAMAKHQLPLLIHGEVTDTNIDIFDREAVFIQRHLNPLQQAIPDLKVVLEHITTQQAVEYVQNNNNIAATITPHHLLYNRNIMLAGGIKPHYYCLPILKRNEHQQALIKAATSGQTCFFAGTDSAPHEQLKKESACGCAGIFNAPTAISCYTHVFEQQDALQHLEGFLSEHGARFYGLKENSTKITLTKTTWQVPSSYPAQNGTVIPMNAGEQLQWQVQHAQ